MAVKASVGGIVKRREDPRLVTGHGLYTGDVAKEAWPHAAFVRSTVAHARIVSVDRDAVLSMPGVVGVFTAADLGLKDQEMPTMAGVGGPPPASAPVRVGGGSLCGVVA